MQAPELSMLWERTDPEAALRERFGFADASAVAGAVADLVATHWGLRVLACERAVLSAQNLLVWLTTSAGPVVVKACGLAALFPRLGVIAEVVARLGDKDLPVAAPRRTLAGPARVLTETGRPLSVVVLPRVSGSLVDAADLASVYSLGETLARVHAALAEEDVELPALPAGRALMAAASQGADWLAQLASGPVGRERAPRAAARVDALLADLPPLDVPGSLVHGDVRGANVLVDRGRTTALLDYDSLLRGHRVLDLAGGAVMLATRFHTWDPPPPGSRAHLVAGYRAVTALTPAEDHWLEAAVLAAGLSQIPPGADPAGWAAAVERGI